MAEVPDKLEESLNSFASPFPNSAMFILEKRGSAHEGFNRKLR
jgi:hypothetical protein